jgi:hypothetical protein
MHLPHRKSVKMRGELLPAQGTEDINHDTESHPEYI